MLKNSKILEEWYEPFKKNKQLSLQEAKKLYLKMVQCENEEEKKEIKDTLIFGTMYVLYEQLKSSLAIYCSSSVVDMEDIIATSFEIWFKFLSEGGLMRIKYYSDFFKIFFFEYLAKSIWPSDFSTGNYFGWEEHKLLKCLTKYILFRKNVSSVSVQEFENIFAGIPISFYSLFEEIYHLIFTLGVFCDEILSERKLSFFILFLLSSYLEIPFNPKDKECNVLKIKTEEELDLVEKYLLRKQTNDIYIKIEIPSKRNQEIFETRCGYKEKKTLEEIVQSHRYPTLTSEEGVRKASENARRRLLKQKRDVSELRKIYEELT